MKPTVVLIQGSFQTPLVYKSLVDGLKSQGYPVLSPALPSCTGSDDPDFANRTLIDDALAVRLELTRLIEYDCKKVVVVMHSYGGLVGSEAVVEDLSYSQRQSRGLPGGIIHLFYYCAFILPKGESVLSMFGESSNNDVRPNGRFIIRNAAKTIYSDLPATDAALWESRLTVQSYGVQKTKLTHEPYRFIPSTYLVCGKDEAVPEEVQKMFARSANARIEHCNAGHSPHLSQPKMLVNTIVKTVERTTSTSTRNMLEELDPSTVSQGNSFLGDTPARNSPPRNPPPNSFPRNLPPRNSPPRNRNSPPRNSPSIDALKLPYQSNENARNSFRAK